MIAEALICLALNVYHEARGEPLTGQRAVAHVALNRVADASFPSTVCGVVLQGGELRRGRCQFSWWCDGRSDDTRDQEAWDVARAVAWSALGGSHDPTGGALYYHSTSARPAWRLRFTATARIGRHTFYRETMQ